jgi:transcriptional regulator GlxA family with amidase domain
LTRFRPGGAPSLLGISAATLRDRSVPLVDLWGPEARALEDRLVDDPRHATETLESAMLRRSSARTSEDALMRAVLHELGGERLPDVTVPTLARRLEISERNLRRRCTAAFGYGPKMLMRVLRFRRAVRLLQARQAPAEVAATTGFSDQAHLSFEFRRLAGACPSEVANGQPIVLSANGVD